MSHVLVYCPPDLNLYGVQRRDELRAEGHTARVIWIGEHLVHALPCDWVEVVGEPDGRIEAVYGDRVRGGPDPVADWRVEKTGMWYTALGPDGKIGKSVRTEREAWDLIHEARDAGLA